MNTMITNNFSWVLKNVLSQREYIHTLQPVWDELLNSERFKMKKAYDKMMEADRVHWSGLMRKNCARPRAIHTTWLACHGRLGTKDRLVRFGMITDKICSLCKEVEETQNHILFSCKVATDIWSNVLNWIGIDHVPQEWPLELDWLLNLTNRKGWRAYLLKLSVTETIYGIWIHRNSKIFGDNTYRNTSKDVSDGIIENIVYRGWGSKKLRKHIASLMI